MAQRDSFKFYRSYFDVLNELPEKHQLEYLKAILNKQFFNQEPVLTGIVKLAYISQKFNIDKQVKGFLDKTGIDLKPPTQGGTQGGMQDPKEQSELENKKKLKSELENKKAEFKNSLYPFFSNENDLNDFYLYWTEHGINDKKMRFEKEKSFGLERRVSTWMRNKEKFNTQKNGKELTAVEKLNNALLNYGKQ